MSNATPRTAGPELWAYDQAEALKLPSIQTVSYSFPGQGLHTTRDADRIRRVEESYEQFAKRHGLFSDLSRYRDVISVYIRTGAVSNADPEVLAGMTRILTLIMHFNDRVGEPGLAEQISASLQAFWDPATAQRQDVGSISATLELASELVPYRTAQPGAYAAFLAAIERTWCAFLHESVYLERLPKTRADYEQLRPHTLATYPFLRGLQLLTGFPDAMRARHGQRLAQLDALATRVMYLVNDLGSVARDLQRRQRNAVLLASFEQGLSLEAGYAQIRSEHDRAANELHCELTQMTQDCDSAAIHRYLDGLTACTAGNLEALKVLQERYARASSQYNG